MLWPNLGLVSVRYSACRAAVPRGPWSSAISHSFNHETLEETVAASAVLLC